MVDTQSMPHHDRPREIAAPEAAWIVGAEQLARRQRPQPASRTPIYDALVAEGQRRANRAAWRQIFQTLGVACAALALCIVLVAVAL